MRKTRQDFERAERTELAPYALFSDRSAGRRHPEPTDPHRSVYQRDRDRIVHTGAFRRLERKTQVVIAGQGDNFRNRLTHSLEVAQISRSMARVLGLNESFVEALALAHDVGHPPFGHSGEEELRQLMRDHGGFDHNVQALRVIDWLERPYPEWPGLNLTRETRESILKHGLERAGDLARDFRQRRHPWLEAQLVDLADSITYHAHDLEDGLRVGVFVESDLAEVGLWQRAHAAARARYPDCPDDRLRRPTIHRALQLPILDLTETTAVALEEAGIRDADRARDHDARLVSFSLSMAREQAELQRFLFARFYRAPHVIEARTHARRLLRELFEHFLDRPEDMAVWAQRLASDPAGEGLHRAVCDYLAGMTDRFAFREHERLVAPE